MSSCPLIQSYKYNHNSQSISSSSTCNTFTISSSRSFMSLSIHKEVGHLLFELPIIYVVLLSSVVEVLYPIYRRPPVTAQQIWIRPCSLQRQTAQEPYTSYRIWSHYSYLKGRDHQLNRTKLRHSLHRSLYPPPPYGHGQVGFHHLSTRSKLRLMTRPDTRPGPR
jgi:hypothetical protein